MKKIITVDGNEACANVAYDFTEVAGIYPITPSSPMAEYLDEWSNNGKNNIFNDKVKVVEMQSEAGAAGMIHGSLQAGCLTTTFTASQGLLLMIPNMYKMAGEMLPCVMHVAARSLSTHALSIFGDHQDIYAARMTGFSMIASSSVQDTAYLSIITHLAAIDSSLPFMHFFDGFRTSHEIQKISVLESKDYKNLINYNSLEKFRQRALNPLKPYTIGTAQNDDIYFQATEARNKFYNELPDIVNGYMEKINELADTDYKLFNYYGNHRAKNIIVAMGSVCETIKETIDELKDYGLVEVHLYRPFSTKYLLNVLPNTVENIAVLDRTKEIGSNGEPLYLDILSALKDKNINIVGGRYGLSSKNTTPSHIKAVFDMLEKKPINNFTIGITDDVTNLSLKADEKFILNNNDEILVYGYGSDGMVSASKSLIKIVGETTDKYVQGYFQYDSKKSGGVTLGHLRFSNNPIKATYYCENPGTIVLTKDTYLNQFDIISKIQKNGTFIINTIKSKDEILDYLSDNVKYIIESRNIKLYIINAYEVAVNSGLKNKISTIMESVIFYLSNIIDYDKALDEMKKFAHKTYFKKGEDIVKANYKAIDDAIKSLQKVELKDNHFILEEENVNKNIFNAVEKRLGDKLPTSAFLNSPGGIFESGTSQLEKRCISDSVPTWISENCIQCNQCSFVCPHAVIRPYLLTEEEYNDAPEYVKSECIKPIEVNLKDYYYAIGISVKDCTGCGLCINTCPGKKGEKALTFKNLDDEIKENKQKIFDYLDKNIKYKNLIKETTVKGSQFLKPKFMFSGACAGCGETAYIKLLTQLFGDNLIISNATGCSSIYGASAPSTPYTIPWASSLFEDNAEYGFGMYIANSVMRNRIKNIMQDNMDLDKENFTKWLDNMDNYEITKQVYYDLDYDKIPDELVKIKDYIISKTTWIIGGDGWAYDIGFSGIDHVLASNENVNILVLNSQVYSNTGGQSSKASPQGSIAKFTSNGKSNNKKDLARIAMSYPNCYVAQTSLGANPQQLIKAFTEANNYDGPSIIIAYTPCISHGIKGGLSNSIEMEKLAVSSGYYPIFRYNPEEKKFHLDSKNVNFDLYEEFLNSQTRYNMLKVINKENAEKLLNENKLHAMEEYEYYKKLDE